VEHEHGDQHHDEAAQFDSQFPARDADHRSLQVRSSAWFQVERFGFVLHAEVPIGRASITTKAWPKGGRQSA
jgi:hypothetical protein